MTSAAGRSWDRLTRHWRTNGVALIGLAMASDEVVKFFTGSSDFSVWWFVMGLGQFLGFATAGTDPRKEQHGHRQAD